MLSERRLVVEVAVLVAGEGVAGDVPAVDDVAALPFVVEVAAPGRADDAEPPRLATGRARRPGSSRIVARNPGTGLPVAPGTDVVAGRGDEDVQHLGGADAVDDRAAPVAARIASQVSWGRCSPALTAVRTPASRPTWPSTTMARYAVGAVNSAVTPWSCTSWASSAGRGLLGEQRAGAGAEREHHEHAQAEGEGQRGGARDHVVGLEPHDVPPERLGDRRDVAVEVHGELGDAGRARGRPEQGDVVGCGLDGGELTRLRRRSAGHRSSSPSPPNSRTTTRSGGHSCRARSPRPRRTGGRRGPRPGSRLLPRAARSRGRAVRPWSSRRRHRP